MVLHLFLASDDDGLTQREKRRQEFEKSNKGMKGVDASGLKRFAVPIIIIGLLGIVVTAMVLTANAEEECPGHWHSSYTILIDGQRVPFNHPAFGAQDNADAPGTHLHGDDGIYHFHPAVPRCTPMEDGLANLGVEVTDDRLVLEDVHGVRAGTYEENATHELRIFRLDYETGWPNDWQETDAGVLDGQPANGDGIVVIYGDHTEEEIEALLASAKTLEQTTYDPDRL